MDREELHRLVIQFDKHLRSGNVCFAQHVTDALGESLAKVRIAEDGLVDPDSVDARVRALLLSVSELDSDEKANSSVSLREIQEEFYGIIQMFFDPLYQQTLKHSATPYAVASDFANDAERVKLVDADVLEFLSTIEEFWSRTSFSALCHCEGLEGTKGVFSSSLFPETGADIVSRCGLYLDTLCLPDPFLRIAAIAQFWSPEERVREVVRFGLKLLQYRDAVLADVDPPIAVIIPDQFGTNAAYRNLISSVSELDILRHSSVVFGQDFSSVEELREYTGRFTSSHELVRALARPERLLFDSENSSPLEEQIDTYFADEGRILNLSRVGDIVYTQALGRMQQANDALVHSKSVGGVPVMDAETSWRYFNWKLEYDAGRHEGQEDTGLHVVHALQGAARGDMRWIGKIPLDALVEIRRSGALEEIRSILGSGVREIAHSRPSDFRATTSQVAQNVRHAFEEHERRLDELRKKKWRFAGRDIGSWIVVGTIEIGAAILGSPLIASALGIGGFVAHQLLDAPRLRDIPARVRELKKEKVDLQESAMGLLFKQRESHR